MSVLMAIIMVQAIAGFVVAWVLKAVLNQTLIDLGIRYLEVYQPSESQKKVEKIRIVSHQPLKQAVVDRLRRVVSKNFSSSVVLEWNVEKKMWGGLMVYINDQPANFSLKDRVKRACQTR